jgi:hypothetical protein
LIGESLVNLLVLHDGDGQKIAGDLLKTINQQKLKGESLPEAGDWEALSNATHIIAIIPQPASPSGPSWFAFAAGFARGAGIPLVVYGAGDRSLPPYFGKDLIHCTDEADFAAYLVREAEDWTREHTRKQARQTLLDRGIPVTVDSLGRCIAEKDGRAAALFLAAGFSPDTLDRNGVPLLCLAARAGDREIAGRLLKAGASVNLPARDRGGSALIDAALGKHAGILTDLLGAGANSNVTSKDGQSALIIAVGLGDEPSVELLLKSGADADAPDSLGASARKYAALFNKPGIVSLFKTYAPEQ